MNRNELFRIIETDLHRDADDDVAPSLNATVQRVMQAMQSERHATSSSLATPVPLEIIAAYVDGTLSDDEVTQIDQILPDDPSAVTEIVSAIRAQHPIHPSTSDDRPSSPLPDDLRTRLLAIGHQSPSPITRTSPRPAIPKSVGWSIAATVAAMLLGMIVWQFRRPAMPTNTPNPPTDAPRIAVDTSSNQPNGNFHDAPVDGPQFAAPQLNGPILDGSPNRDGVANLAEKTPATAPTTTPSNPTLPPMIAPPDSVATDTPTEPLTKPAPSVTPTAQEIRSTAPTPSLRRLRWDAISGIVALRSSADGSSRSSESSSRSTAWRSATESETLLIAANTDSPDGEPFEAYRIKTLPLTRASATLDGGGKWVIDEDSLLVIGNNGSIDLQYGSLAMIDTPAGTRWQFGDRTQTGLASTSAPPEIQLQSVEPGTVILHRDAGGFRVEIQSGRFEIDGQPASQQPSVAAIKRMPGWATRPIQRIDVHRTFLAQLRDTNDLTSTLADQIRQIESGQNIPRGAATSLPTLCRWQAASLDDQLHRLMGSSSEPVRLAALDRLFNVRTDDPRNAFIWSALGNNVRDARSVAFVRSLFRLAWQRSKLTPTQVTRVITMLESDNVAARAMADYLLRRFYGGGPRFDPTWTGPTLTRAANGWRAWIARQR